LDNRAGQLGRTLDLFSCPRIDLKHQGNFWRG
jgi:hypothetical protein